MVGNIEGTLLGFYKYAELLNILRSMEENFIKIRGAKVHNLKNISLDIPRNKLVVITGLSGSGKSSLAFDTIYAEGQRRYVESLSAYARQYLGVMQKPDVEKIEGISPAISIDQRTVSRNPRSTVGTASEIYDYLRLLFGRIGEPHCPKCGKVVSRQSVEQIVEQILGLPKNKEILILGSVIRAKKGEHGGILDEIQRAGFVRVRIDGIVHRLEEALSFELERTKKHDIEVVVDRLVLEQKNKEDRARITDSVEQALKIGKGTLIIGRSQMANSKLQKRKNDKRLAISDLLFSEHFACEECGLSLPEIEPRLFSFNSPYGACPVCTGLGSKLEVDPDLVIPNKKLTISEGAIRPWMHASHRLGRQSYYWWKLQELASKYKFLLDVPVKDLPRNVLKVILYGDKDFAARPKAGLRLAEVASATQAGEPRLDAPSGWEGVVQNLERRYHETDSDWSRQEIERYMNKKECPECRGKRLKPEVLAVTVAGLSIDKIVGMSVSEIKKLFEGLSAFSVKSGKGKNQPKLSQNELKIAKDIIKEIINRLQFLIDVGLDYLTLDRESATLSGGEAQRIRLANQIGSKLTGVTYILDEPSIGLHPRDQGKLIETLKKLRDLQNTVIVVEHDVQTIKKADWIIDIGPGAGKHGGEVIFEGTPQKILKARTLTGDYLSNRKRVEMPQSKVKKPIQDNSKLNYLIIRGATENNLKNIDVKIPFGKFICITGVSGSGKSSLVNDILARALLQKFYNAKDAPGEHKEISGTENLNKVVLVDQSPIGRTPRSNPATYTGIFSFVRTIFSLTKEARIRGYSPGRFSFNVKGGRCEACEGQGLKRIKMYFLPDVYVECEECRGKRYNKEALQIEYRGKNIAEVLEMTVEEALTFFKNIPGLYQKLKTLNEVGLSYIELGQPAPSLSGGEAQRVKLATELSRKDTGKTLYILDEPTTGLHPDDIKKLLWVLHCLVERGNTVLVVEHNLDIIKNADWICDLGPEGGNDGGYIMAEGIPKDIIKNKKSYTGQYLKKVS